MRFDAYSLKSLNPLKREAFMPANYYEIFGFKTKELPDDYEKKFHEIRLAWDPDRLRQLIHNKGRAINLEKGRNNTSLLPIRLLAFVYSLEKACDAEIQRIFNEKDKAELNESLKYVNTYHSENILLFKAKALFNKIDEAIQTLSDVSMRNLYNDYFVRSSPQQASNTSSTPTFISHLPPEEIQRIILTVLELEEKSRGEKFADRIRLSQFVLKKLLVKWGSHLNYHFTENSINRGGILRLLDGNGSYRLDALPKGLNNKTMVVKKGGYGKVKFPQPLTESKLEQSAVVIKAFYSKLELVDQRQEHDKIPPEELSIHASQNQFLAENAMKISQRIGDNSVQPLSKLVWDYNERCCVLVDSHSYVMQYFPGETLFNFIKKGQGKIPFQDAWQISINMMQALKKFHDQGIIHRDASFNNFIINPETKQAYLVDREFALLAGDENKPYPRYSRSKKRVEHIKFGAIRCGTHEIDDPKVTNKKDCYSLGYCLGFLFENTRQQTAVEKMFSDRAKHRLLEKHMGLRWSMENAIEYFQDAALYLKIRQTIETESLFDYNLARIKEWKKLLKNNYNISGLYQLLKIFQKSMSTIFPESAEGFFKHNDLQRVIYAHIDRQEFLLDALEAYALYIFKEAYKTTQERNGAISHIERIIKKIAAVDGGWAWSFEEAARYLEQTLHYLQYPSENLKEKIELLSRPNPKFEKISSYAKTLLDWKIMCDGMHDCWVTTLNLRALLAVFLQAMPKNYVNKLNDLLGLQDIQKLIESQQSNKTILADVFEAAILQTLNELFSHSQNTNFFTRNPFKSLITTMKKESFLVLQGHSPSMNGDRAATVRERSQALH
jgi:serine/threonine protein kinase